MLNDKQLFGGDNRTKVFKVNCHKYGCKEIKLQLSQLQKINKDQNET